MKKKLIIFLFLITFFFNFVSSAHYIVGYVFDSPSGESPENMSVIVSDNITFDSYQIVDIVGKYGNSGADNVYMWDIDIYPFYEGDYLKIIDDSNRTRSKTITIKTSLSGYTLQDELRLYPIDNSLNIIFPENNSFWKKFNSKIEIIMGGIDGCFYSINESNNTRMNVIKEFAPKYTNKINISLVEEDSEIKDIYHNSSNILVLEQKEISLGNYESKIYEYNKNFTYLGNSYVLDKDIIKISKINDTYILSNGTDLFYYYEDLTYTGIEVSLNETLYSSSNKKMSCRDNYCYILSFDYKIYKDYLNSTYEYIFTLPIENSDPIDIELDENYLYVSDLNNSIYIYNHDGTYFDKIENPFLSFYTLSSNESQIFSIIDNSRDIAIINKMSNTNYWEAEENKTDGLYESEFICNNSLGDVERKSAYFTIDTIKPNIFINNLSTIQGSQTFNFLSTINDTNKDSCKYSIYNSNNSIDGLNENITFNCDEETSATTTSYGNFTLMVYAEDLAGNENYTEKDFTLIEAEGEGGGGGTTIVQPGNWSIATSSGRDLYEIILIRGTERELTFLLYNYGEEEIQLTIECEDIEGEFCENVNFSEKQVTLPDIKGLATEETIRIVTPEDAKEGNVKFNIVAREQSGASRSLSVDASLEVSSPIEEVLSKVGLRANKFLFFENFPYYLILLIGLFSSAILGNFLLPKYELKGLTVGIISLISGFIFVYLV